MPSNVGNRTEELQFTIASSGTESEARPINGIKVFALILPTMTGATISFKVSDSATGTFVPLYDDAGNLISITATDDACVALTSSAASMGLAPCKWVKLVSASAEAAERSIKLIGRA